MPIKLVNVGIAVRDLEATIAFFTDLGLTVLGRDTVSGEWTDTAVGLDGNHANIAMLQTPDGNGRLELFEYIGLCQGSWTVPRVDHAAVAAVRCSVSASNGVW
jgi:catechol 2,3-dioxygenase-like lactoylglutathione lyase family enzyme